MEIKVKRTKEFKKGGFLSGKNLELALEISVSLSGEEKALVQEYYDPKAFFGDIPLYFKSVETFGGDTLKVISAEPHLSKFKVTVHVDGFKYLEYIQKAENAIISDLTNKLNYLKSLDRWEGEEIITT